MAYKQLVRVGSIVALLVAFAAGVALHSSSAHAAGAPHHSISHYVNFSDYNTTDSMLKNWAKSDASRMDPPGDGATCSNNYYSQNMVVVLDFGNPNESGGVYGEMNWRGAFFNAGALSNFAYDYALSYFANSGVCSHVWVAIGTNNSAECSIPGYSASCAYNAGYYLGSAVAVAEQYLTNPGGDLPKQLVMAGGDDIEYDGTWAWDTYNMTNNVLGGFLNYSSTLYMFDYGYTNTPCNDVSHVDAYCGSGNVGSDGNPIWDSGEQYNVAWGIGRDVPLPESYNPSGFGASWGQVFRDSNNGNCGDCLHAGTMNFWGVMNDDGWNDPGNQYGIFWSNAGNPPVAYDDMDTCMPYGPFNSASDYAAPCY